MNYDKVIGLYPIIKAITSDLESFVVGKAA
jgi:hypothetical protein